MINWTTGAGNARYWVLKLLIDEVGPGDELVKTTVASPSPPGQPYFCGKVDGHVGYSDMTLSCDDVCLRRPLCAPHRRPMHLTLFLLLAGGHHPIDRLCRLWHAHRHVRQLQARVRVALGHFSLPSSCACFASW